MAFFQFKFYGYGLAHFYFEILLISNGTFEEEQSIISEFKSIFFVREKTISNWVILSLKLFISGHVSVIVS